MNPLTTAVGAPHNFKLCIHINDNSLPAIARNMLILKVVTSQEFRTEREEDMDYIWNLWYNTTWPESTCQRFIKDVKELLDNPLPDHLGIPESSQLEGLQQVWKQWLINIETVSVDDVLADRYKE